jgi:hypothetical protein
MPKQQMMVEVHFGRYTVELTGSNAKVWTGPGVAEYEGSIDGIEEKYPDLLKYLGDNFYVFQTRKDK